MSVVIDFLLGRVLSYLTTPEMKQNLLDELKKLGDIVTNQELKMVVDAVEQFLVVPAA